MNRNKRIVIAGIFTVVILIYLARMFYVQVINESYKLSASNNVLRYVIDYPARGLIYDRTGTLMVYNEAVYDLMVIPRQVKSLDTAEFCRLLDITKEEFINKMQTARRYSRFKSSVFEKQIPPEQYAVLQEKLYKFNGFYVQPRTLRKYPTRSAAHALGYIGEVNEKLIEENPYYQMGDYIGISGIEQSYEKELRGKRGLRIVMVDVHNQEKGSYESGKYDSVSVAGENLFLSLDARLQAYAEQLMQNKAGGIAAIEPGTGEILAILSSPSYDPNLMVGKARNKNYALLSTDPYKSLFNRAMMAYYPPGSTFKLAGALSALNEQIISSSTVFPHSFIVGSKSVKCHPHPAVALEGAIQYSCNPYFCNVFRAFVDNRKYGTSENGYRVWRDYIMSFGVGRKIGVDLPHELPGLLPSIAFYDKIYGKGRWKASTIYSLGIGQGELGITPLQMVNITSVIANRGFYYTPHIVKTISGKKNTTRNLSEKHYSKVAPETFNVVIDGMQRVVEAGTARIAQFGNIRICGKTGTAQNPHGKDHSLFVAFAPRENPKIAVAVMVENSGFGATWAAPIASLMMELYLTDTISRPELEKRIIDGNLLKDYPLPGAELKKPALRKDSVPVAKKDTFKVVKNPDQTP
ncbi:MAG: penicillin-binding protein 2 [Bacteroidia bacterium]|nr:penicillin-binding protein 2 [Bacteroidia bacterium]MCZ2277911.1 penicillin-binding protein 2 [Bacteroidia bacterium]